MVPRRYSSKSNTSRASGRASTLRERHWVSRFVGSSGNISFKFAVWPRGYRYRAICLRDIVVGPHQERARGGGI